jgi:hypothetical protein
MKQYLWLCAAGFVPLAATPGLASCSLGSESLYRVVFPAIPDAWREMLGEPRWRVEWISARGEQKLESDGKDALFIDPLAEWTTPVIAYPFWPERGIRADVMKPAGALFPLDAEGGELKLSWRGGVEVFIYWELASVDETIGTPRRPHFFNWPRFRELLADAELNEEIFADLWRVDWELFCQKTALSGFDRRHLTLRKTTSRVVPTTREAVWISASPFAPAIVQAEGESLVIKTAVALDVYVSSRGILRCQGRVWILTEFEESR